MSEWEKKPNEFKDLIDQLFADPKPAREFLEESKAEPKKEVKKPTKKVKLPEPTKQTGEEEKEALKLAKGEMEKIRKAFLEFTDEVNDTIIYSYLYPHIEDFVEKCKQMQTLLDDDIDKDKLTSHGLDDYEEMKKIRGIILNVVLEKYERE